jgi:hypothetical protein
MKLLWRGVAYILEDVDEMTSFESGIDEFDAAVEGHKSLNYIIYNYESSRRRPCQVAGVLLHSSLA